MLDMTRFIGIVVFESYLCGTQKKNVSVVLCPTVHTMEVNEDLCCLVPNFPQNVLF